MRKECNLNDFILILQMKQGNDQAFDKFVRKYYADILSYCRYHCLNQTEAEDITQETFLRFINNIQSYQHMGKAKNYLYVIAGNLCKNSAKKWKAESIETEVLERELVSDGDIPKKENQMYVEHALEQMQPELREIIIMIYFQELKLREIADIMQIGLPLVKYRHKRAKEELKPEVFIQYQGNEAIVADVIEKAKNEFVADGHRASSIKSLQVYLKPEEFAAYYVINQKFAGRVDLF